MQHTYQNRSFYNLSFDVQLLLRKYILSAAHKNSVEFYKMCLTVKRLDCYGCTDSYFCSIVQCAFNYCQYTTTFISNMENSSIKKNRGGSSKFRQKNRKSETLVTVQTIPSTSLNNSIDVTATSSKSFTSKCDVINRVGTEIRVVDSIDLHSSDNENVTSNPSAANIANDTENSIENKERILFENYFRIVEKNNANRNIAACCLTCEKDKNYQVIVRGSQLATSNFIRHLKVICFYFNEIYQEKDQCLLNSLQVNHKEVHSNYLKEKEESKCGRARRNKTAAGLPLSQQQFEQVLINLIVDGMLPISIVSLNAFKSYTHGNNSTFICCYFRRKECLHVVLYCAN